MKTILVTGASSGIGKATAILFSEKGWNVAAIVRNPRGVQDLEMRKNMKIYQADVRNRDHIQTCIEQILKDFKKIDVVINNAGIYTTGPLELTTDEIVDNIVDTNIKGVMNVTKAILEHFRENKAGMIVNVSSIAGRAAFPFQSVYHASKWAIEGLSESLRYELKPLHIQVKVVEPGMVRTNIYDSVLNIPFEEYPDDYRENFHSWHNSLMKNYENGYCPELDAKTIFNAVNDGRSRLRYTTDFSTRMVLFLQSLFPLSVFQNIVRKQSLKEIR